MATGVPSKHRQSGQPYELAYSGKLSLPDILALPVVAPQEIEDVSEHGRLFKGDNLGALLWLLKDPAVHRHVRCVYIDPPYATAQAFLDRNVKHAYDDTLAGAEYLEFLRRRLVVLRELLADDGVIFVHLDQKMIFEIKLVLDEVFGREQFRNFITRKKCNPKNYTRRTFGNIADHLLFYSKTDQYLWHRPYDPWTEERLHEEYPYLDKATGRRYKRVPLHAPGKHWQYPPTRLEELDKAGEIYWSRNGNPRRKVFFDQSQGIPAQDIWLKYKDPHNQNIQITGYPTEKNLDLVCRVLAATSNPGDLVLDCFCGSGTTLEAAIVLGRRFVGIDSSEAAIRATVQRLKAGRQPMGDYVQQRRRKAHKPTQATMFDDLA